MNAARQRVIDIAASYLDRGADCCAEAAPGYDLGKFSWCQIFWLHCLREAGLTQRVWGDLAKSGWTGGWLRTTSHPEAGDLGYIDQPYQHGAIVEWVSADGQRIGTIDGNIGRRVVRKERARSSFDAFYSISPLVENTDGPVKPTNIKGG